MYEFFLEPDWSCACSATLTLVAQREGKTDHSGTIEHVFKAKEKVVQKVGEMPLDVSEIFFKI
jgi:hypothetical protein